MWETLQSVQGWPNELWQRGELKCNVHTQINYWNQISWTSNSPTANVYLTSVRWWLGALSVSHGDIQEKNLHLEDWKKQRHTVWTKLADWRQSSVQSPIWSLQRAQKCRRNSAWQVYSRWIVSKWHTPQWICDERVLSESAFDYLNSGQTTKMTLSILFVFTVSKNVNKEKQLILWLFWNVDQMLPGNKPIAILFSFLGSEFVLL